MVSIPGLVGDRHETKTASVPLLFCTWGRTLLAYCLWMPPLSYPFLRMPRFMMRGDAP